MKKTLQFILTAIFIVSSFVANAQLRITVVDSDNGVVWVRNFGSSAVDIAGYRFAHNNTYPDLANDLTIAGGGTLIGAGMTKLISGFNLTHHSTGSDVALFVPGTNSADFTNPAKMVDFMQYGSSGNPTESVAVSKGIWGTGDYVTGAPGYSYSGDGNQTGVQYWSGVSSVDEITKSGVYTVYPNPAKNKINIQLSRETKLTSYQLVNAVGKVVIEYNHTISEEKIVLDVSDLVKGFYILILNDENELSMQQVIIE